MRLSLIPWGSLLQCSVSGQATPVRITRMQGGLPTRPLMEEGELRGGAYTWRRPTTRFGKGQYTDAWCDKCAIIFPCVLVRFPHKIEWMRFKKS